MVEALAVVGETSVCWTTSTSRYTFDIRYQTTPRAATAQQQAISTLQKRHAAESQLTRRRLGLVLYTPFELILVLYIAQLPLFYTFIG